jgi:cytochrome c-type biogenesis protein CcmH
MRAATRTLHKFALLAGLALLASPLAAQLSNDTRVRTLSKRMMCLCGCNQILGECNHVGCSVSTEMLKKLEARVAGAESDDLILQAFVQEYGPKVMAQPPASGFTLLAWLMPFVVLIGGTFVVRAVLLRWRRQPATVPATPDIAPELLARAAAEADRDDWDAVQRPRQTGNR